MTRFLYRQYDEQRTEARDTITALGQSAMGLLAIINKPEGHDEDRVAAAHFQLGRLGLQQADLADGVKRVAHLEAADHNLLTAFTYYKGRQRWKDAGHALILSALSCLAQGDPHLAEANLREVLAYFKVSVSAIGSIGADLEQDVRKAIAGLTAAYLELGQFDRAREVLLLW